MISCPVCKTSNHHLAIACASCGSYLQRKVDNLDLFDTLWLVIESPAKAFHAISVATHKNYVLVLSAIAGIWEIFEFFRLIEAGEMTAQFGAILIAGILVGPFLGMIVTLTLTLFTMMVLRVLGERAAFRNILAVTGYSQAPIVLMAVFLLPLILMTWGLFFFTKTPPAEQLYPTSFFVVSALTGAGLLWSLILYLVGLKKLLNTGRVKTILLGLCTVLLFGGAISIAVQLIKHL